MGWRRAVAGSVLTVAAAAVVPVARAVDSARREARVSEAKTHLSGIFTAMKAFGGEY